MSNSTGNSRHPQATGGEAGHGPGRGGNKLSGTRPEKYGTRPLPVRPITHLPVPKRPNDTKKLSQTWVIV